MGDCHVLFVAASQVRLINAIRAVVMDQPTLLVSDAKDFILHGGMVGLSLEDGRVAFEVNRTNLERARLSAGAQVLSLATRVETKAHETQERDRDLQDGQLMREGGR